MVYTNAYTAQDIYLLLYNINPTIYDRIFQQKAPNFHFFFFLSFFFFFFFFSLEPILTNWCQRTISLKTQLQRLHGCDSTVRTQPSIPIAFASSWSRCLNFCMQENRKWLRRHTHVLGVPVTWCLLRFITHRREEKRRRKRTPEWETMREYAYFGQFAFINAWICNNQIAQGII